MSETVQARDYCWVTPGSGRCVDDRDGLEYHAENRSVQMPGASSHLMDLMQLSIISSRLTVKEAQLFDMTESAYRSSFATSYGARPGLHIDDEHGHLSLSQTRSRVAGCGHDAVRTRVMKHMGVDVSYSSGERILEARRRGWGIQVLTGAHGGVKNLTPTAAVNHMEGMTLDTGRLLREDRVPSFNYDKWFAIGMLDVLMKELHNNGFERAEKVLDLKGEEFTTLMYYWTLRELKQEGYLTTIG